MYYISVPLALFLMAVLCFLIFEESWRVEGKICDHFLTVMMEDCNEGDIADGYMSLCWVTIALVSFAAVAVALTFIKQRAGISGLIQFSKYSRGMWPLTAVGVALTIGVGTYAFFITLLVYQVSCGKETTHDLDLDVYRSPVTTWDYDEAERILVFFTVGMALWHFSMIAQCLEFVTASYTAQTFFQPNSGPIEKIRKATSHLLCKHLGSVALAAAALPLGRVVRNIMNAMKWTCHWVKAEKMMTSCMHTALYSKYFALMTSDPLAYQAVLGSSSFMQSAKRCSFLYERHGRELLSHILSNSEALIWLFQLVLTLISPVFVMYWILHEDDVFQDVSTKDVSSVIAMGIYGLFFSWFAGQMYGAFARGMLYGSVVSYLIDIESNSSGERVCDGALRLFLEGQTPTAQTPKVTQPTPEKPKEALKNVAVAEEVTRMVPSQPIRAPPPSRGGNRDGSVVDVSMNEVDQLLAPKTRKPDD